MCSIIHVQYLLDTVKFMQPCFPPGMKRSWNKANNQPVSEHRNECSLPCLQKPASIPVCSQLNPFLCVVGREWVKTKNVICGDHVRPPSLDQVSSTQLSNFRENHYRSSVEKFPYQHEFVKIRLLTFVLYLWS